MKEKKNGENGKQLPAPPPPPKPLLVGSTVEIIMQWGHNEPIPIGTVKVSAQDENNFFTLRLPTQFHGSSLIVENPVDRNQRFVITAYKEGTLKKMKESAIKQAEEAKKKDNGQTTKFQSDINNLRKQN